MADELKKLMLASVVKTFKDYLRQSFPAEAHSNLGITNTENAGQESTDLTIVDDNNSGNTEQMQKDGADSDEREEEGMQEVEHEEEVVREDDEEEDQEDDDEEEQENEGEDLRDDDDEELQEDDEEELQVDDEEVQDDEDEEDTDKEESEDAAIKDLASQSTATKGRSVAKKRGRPRRNTNIPKGARSIEMRMDSDIARGIKRKDREGDKKTGKRGPKRSKRLSKKTNDKSTLSIASRLRARHKSELCHRIFFTIFNLLRTIKLRTAHKL